MRRHQITALAIVCGALAGCGSSGPAAVTTTPAAKRSSVEGTGVVVRGDYGPDERGPFRFDGRYRVRFVQRGADVDFKREVPFTALLVQPAADGPGKRIPLFEQAARSGTRTIEIHGQFRVAVDFGDSPYEIRFARVAG
jgi:predicted small lipoprotein YifL